MEAPPGLSPRPVLRLGWDQREYLLEAMDAIAAWLDRRTPPGERSRITQSAVTPCVSSTILPVSSTRLRTSRRCSGRSEPVRTSLAVSDWTTSGSNASDGPSLGHSFSSSSKTGAGPWRGL